MRNALKKKIRELVNDRGPQIFNDFEEIKQRQLEKIYKDSRSTTKSQYDVLETEVDECLEELKDMGY